MKPKFDLYALEWSAFRSVVNRRIITRIAAILFALVAVSIIIWRRTYPPESIFALGGLILWTVSFFMSIFQTASLMASPFREWWITMPMPREVLIRAKLAAAMRLQLYIAGGLWAAAALYILLSSLTTTETEAYLNFDSFAAAGAAYAILYAALTPMLVSLGYSMLVMYTGWARIGLIPFSLFIAPIGIFGFIAEPNETVLRWLSPSAVLGYAAIAAVLGALIYRAAVYGASRKGMRDLAAYRSREEAGRSVQSKSQSHYIEGVEGGFTSLYRLERTRLRHFSMRKPVRLLRLFFSAVILVTSFFAVDSESGIGENWFYFNNLIIIIAVAASYILPSLLVGSDLTQRRLEWWLCFPYGRKKLLFSRLVALWITVQKYAAGAWLLMLIGTAVRVAADGGYAGDIPKETLTFAYMLAVYLLAFTLILFLMQFQYYTYRKRILTWVYLPVTIGCFFTPFALINYVLPAEKLAEAGVGAGQWWTLLIIFAAGIPVAYMAFAAGAKWMHLNLQEVQKQKEPKSLE